MSPGLEPTGRGRPRPPVPAAQAEPLWPWAALALPWLLGAAASAYGVTAAAPAATPAATPAPAAAPGAEAAALSTQVRDLALTTLPPGGTGPAPRVEVELGSLDPRLKLAPCERIGTSLPPGTRLWGRSRIQLQCLQGPVAWRAWLPVTVRIFGPGLSAAAALPEGTVLTAQHLATAEVEYTAAAQLPLTQPQQLIGRALARPLATGEAVRESDLRARVWFQGGEMVQVHATGDGYTVATEGRAEAAGIEGRTVRVRTEGGRVVEGRAVGPRRVEVAL